MNKLYKAKTWENNGVYRVQCSDLVGTSRNWSEPARILGIHPADLIAKLRNNFNANLTVYRTKEGKISFIGYSWTTSAAADKWKNYINKMAREGNHLL